MRYRSGRTTFPVSNYPVAFSGGSGLSSARGKSLITPPLPKSPTKFLDQILTKLLFISNFSNLLII